LDDNDWHDVRLLCERFQIALPDEYLKFRRQRQLGVDGDFEHRQR
jgi:hypothetical protein